MNNKKPLNGPSFEFTDNPEKLVFLLHGYGDSGENFIQLAKYLYNPKFNINFFAPNAPSFVPQYPSGRQWFDLYPNGVNFNEAGIVEKEMLKQDCFSSLDLINNYIKNLCSKYKLTFKDCFIIGFSQGAMMTFEFGKYIDNLFAGCVLLSGRIIPSENHEKKSRHFFSTNFFRRKKIMKLFVFLKTHRLSCLRTKYEVLTPKTPKVRLIFRYFSS